MWYSQPMTSKRKSECTPEEWAEHLAYHRAYRDNNREAYRSQTREYQAKPEVKERRKARDMRPDVAERRHAYNSTEEAAMRRKERHQRLRADPDKWAVKIESQRKRRTGFSKAEIDALMILQDSRCAVCERHFDNKQVRADHCHDSGKPRGLLCHHCNIIEGMLRSMSFTPEEFAIKLSAYLTHPPFLKLPD